VVALAHPGLGKEPDDPPAIGSALATSRGQPQTFNSHVIIRKKMLFNTEERLDNSENAGGGRAND
jgi:hypothetical protein